MNNIQLEIELQQYMAIYNNIKNCLFVYNHYKKDYKYMNSLQIYEYFKNCFTTKRYINHHEVRNYNEK